MYISLVMDQYQNMKNLTAINFLYGLDKSQKPGNQCSKITVDYQLLISYGSDTSEKTCFILDWTSAFHINLLTPDLYSPLWECNQFKGASSRFCKVRGMGLEVIWEVSWFTIKTLYWNVTTFHFYLLPQKSGRTANFTSPFHCNRAHRKQFGFYVPLHWLLLLRCGHHSLNKS